MLRNYGIAIGRCRRVPRGLWHSRQWDLVSRSPPLRAGAPRRTIAHTHNHTHTHDPTHTYSRPLFFAPLVREHAPTQACARPLRPPSSMRMCTTIVLRAQHGLLLPVAIAAVAHTQGRWSCWLSLRWSGATWAKCIQRGRLHAICSDYHTRSLVRPIAILFSYCTAVTHNTRCCPALLKPQHLPMVVLGSISRSICDRTGDLYKYCQSFVGLLFVLIDRVRHRCRRGGTQAVARRHGALSRLTTRPTHACAVKIDGGGKRCTRKSTVSTMRGTQRVCSCRKNRILFGSLFCRDRAATIGRALGLAMGALRRDAHRCNGWCTRDQALGGPFCGVGGGSSHTQEWGVMRMSSWW